MKKYEYTVLEVPSKGFFGMKIDYKALAAKLNELGKQGWELGKATDATWHQSASRTVIIILKRELIY